MGTVKRTPGEDDIKPSAETLGILNGIVTEIGAGKVMFPISEADRAHNHACERAISIIHNYREGYGLFQMTARKKKKEEQP
jgi:hypothetical protein